MKRVFLGLCVLAAIALAGCGGGGGGAGGGGGGGGTIDANCALLGTWQPIEAKINGTSTIVEPKIGFNWENGWTREEQEFRQNATCTRKAWNGTSLVATIQGTFSSEQQVAPITFNGETITMSYGAWGDVLDATFTRGGTAYHTRWVNMKTLTNHDNGFAKTYLVNGIKINGATTSISDYFGLASSSNQLTFQLLDDGTLAFRELSVKDIVARQDGTWRTGGGLILLQTSDRTMRASWDSMGFTYLDEQGRTISLTYDWWVVGGADWPPSLIRKWHMDALHQDGSLISINTFFGWDPSVDYMNVQFWADGTAESTESTDGGTSYHAASLGTWGVVPTDMLQVSFDKLFQGVWAFEGSNVTMNWDQDGHHYKLIMTPAT